MRDFLKSSGRWLQAGWLLPLVLLVLPSCILNSGPFEEGGEKSLVFDPGADPRSGAIMCDIPKVPDPEASECADAADIQAGGIRLSYAAIALAQGEPGNSLGLDYSKDALDTCEQMPKKVVFHGPFPDGSQVCLNCSQIPETYVDPAAACVAKCVDLVNLDGKEPPGGAQSWCAEKAKVSTNFTELCHKGGCSDSGIPVPFDDLRRYQVPVKWVDLGGQANVSDQDLSKIGGVPGNVDSGASADVLITRGDAWVEFQAKETDKTHVVSVSTDTGPDTDYTLADIGYSISLNADGYFYIVEDGANYVSAPIDQYLPEQRFRVRITDNGDGTAKISYTKLTGVCKPGIICPEVQIAEQNGPSPSYPLRIKALFREPDATLSNVTVVHIQEQP
jgi:hypothetical protein